jgi:AcrR family transcriptional regulator
VPRPSRQRRAEITRHRVIDAAIEAFGMEGFERTSTRAVVERAGTNLVSIHYHFGGKEALYRAAAEHIASSIRERSRAVLERAQMLLATRGASRRQLIDCACDVHDEFTGLVLAGGLPECWRRFLTREQADPTDTGAFEVIFKAIAPFFETMIELISRVIGQPVQDGEVRLLTMMIMGQMSALRINRSGALKLLGWKHIGAEEMREIRRVSRKYTVKLLEGAAPPPTPRAHRMS